MAFLLAQPRMSRAFGDRNISSTGIDKLLRELVRVDTASKSTHPRLDATLKLIPTQTLPAGYRDPIWSSVLIPLIRPIISSGYTSLLPELDPVHEFGKDHTADSRASTDLSVKGSIS